MSLPDSVSLRVLQVVKKSPHSVSRQNQVLTFSKFCFFFSENIFRVLICLMVFLFLFVLFFRFFWRGFFLLSCLHFSSLFFVCFCVFIFFFIFCGVFFHYSIFLFFTKSKTSRTTTLTTQHTTHPPNPIPQASGPLASSSCLGHLKTPKRDTMPPCLWIMWSSEKDRKACTIIITFIIICHHPWLKPLCKLYASAV